MRYFFISRQMSSFPVRALCRVLRVSAAGYDDWVRRQPSVTERRRDELAAAIRGIHADVTGRYGSRRMHAESKSRGQSCSVNTVAKAMRPPGIQAISHRRFRVRTADSNHEFPVAGNVANRDFTAPTSNEVWPSDITFIPTREGWLYLAAVEDLYSRRIVGWSMGTSLESRLVVDALHMAVAQRFPDDGLLAHSDQGSQYAGEHYQWVLANHGIACSMSRIGNCYDNAPMGSFFASLKKELVHHEDDPTIEAAKASLFGYIEVFYDRLRRHSSLGYVAPEEFEPAECTQLCARFSWGIPNDTPVTSVMWEARTPDVHSRTVCTTESSRMPTPRPILLTVILSFLLSWVPTTITWHVQPPACFAQAPKAGESMYRSRPTTYWAKQLADKDAAARADALKTLAMIGPDAKAAIHAIITALDDDETAVRTGALSALARFGPVAKAAIPVLVRSLADKKGVDTDAVARALFRISPDDPAVVSALAETLLETDPRRRSHLVVVELRRLGHAAKAAVPVLAKRLAGRDPSHRAMLFHTLESFGPDAVPVLLEAWKDKDPEVRVGVYLGIADLGPDAKPFIPLLAKALRDVGKEGPIRALGRIGADAIPALLEAFADPEQNAVRLAGEAIGAMGTKGTSAIPALIERLKDQHSAGGAIPALRGLGAAGTPALIETVKDKARRDFALVALGGLGPPPREALLAMIRALRDNEPWAQAVAESRN